MQYLCNKHGFEHLYPTEPGERAMTDAAMCYHLATLYPLVARATYPTLGFAQYAGEGGTAADATDELKAQAASDAAEAIAKPPEVYRIFFLDGRPFIGGDRPSIADIRLSATLEFLKAIDYDFPDWATDYLARMEETLGDAYTEPAADVRGYIEYVRSQA